MGDSQGNADGIDDGIDTPNLMEVDLVHLDTMDYGLCLGQPLQDLEAQLLDPFRQGAAIDDLSHLAIILNHQLSLVPHLHLPPHHPPALYPLMFDLDPL